MNDKIPKPKKSSHVHFRQNAIPKHPSASSLKPPKSHMLPKQPPNITGYHKYGHARKNLEENHKQNKNRENNIHCQHVPQKKEDNNATTHTTVKSKNVLMQGRKSKLDESGLRRTQKRGRKGQVRSQWVSPDDDGLGCPQHLSSQIFRQSGHPSVIHVKTDQTKQTAPLPTDQQLLFNFDRRLPWLAWQQAQSFLSQQIKQQQQLSSAPFYSNYLQKQTQLTWFHRAVVLNWALQLAADMACRREVFAVLVSLLDRYLAAGPVIKKEQLQVTTAACLLIAQKLEDNSRIRANEILDHIGQSLEELLSKEIEITMVLKFKLKAPTVNSWANRLCAQWDLWLSQEGTNSGISVRFKQNDDQSYHNWRTMAQYIDFALLDIQTLPYKNRTLAAAFLYITLVLRTGLYSCQQVAQNFRKQSQLILAKTPFNELFSRFLVDSFGFPLQDILPTVQYCSGFAILPTTFEDPRAEFLRNQEPTFEEYSAIQTCNPNNKSALQRLDRVFR